MLYYLTTVLYVLVCFVLMLVILLQQGKGGDIASAFGGGGSQAAFGARSGATVLSRATAIGAVLFIVGALVLGIIGPARARLGGRRPRPAGHAGTGAATPPAQPTPASPTPATAGTGETGAVSVDERCGADLTIRAGSRRVFRRALLPRCAEVAELADAPA